MNFTSHFFSSGPDITSQPALHGLGLASAHVMTSETESAESESSDSSGSSVHRGSGTGVNGDHRDPGKTIQRF